MPGPECSALRAQRRRTSRARKAMTVSDTVVHCAKEAVRKRYELSQIGNLSQRFARSPKVKMDGWRQDQRQHDRTQQSSNHRNRQRLQHLRS